MEPPDLGIGPDLVPILHDLAKRNSFTLEELAENRAGRIARSQRRRFKPWLLRSYVRLAVYVCLSLGLLVAVVVSTRNRVEALLFGLLLLSASSWSIWCRAQCSMRLLRDIREARAASVEGPGVAFSNGSRSLPRSYYLIGGKRFRVDKDASEALARGVYYRAYYAPKSDTLLRVEPLRRRQPRQPVASQGERSDGADQG